MFDTNFCFTPGKLTTQLDGGAGSSGKGKLESFICSHADNWQFACCTNSPNAGHWVKLDDGRSFFYQALNSCAHLVDKYEKLYIGPGATIELPALVREITENGVPPHKLGISPVTAILQDIDGYFEKGTHDFDGNPIGNRDGGYLAKTGTTAHGAGACRARRVLRRPEAKYARDIPELKQYLCDVPGEIMRRLDRGQSGLLSIGQGFQLSYLLPEFFPFTTARNVTVAAGLDDMMIPPYYAGNTIINFRTYPIRISSNKYLDKTTGAHLTWEEIQTRLLAVGGGTLEQAGITLVKGDSGPGYPDQKETTWERLTETSGSPTTLMEMTSVTKLPRRVFTFSVENLKQAILHNRANGEVFISINFANYIDYALTGKRGGTIQSSPNQALVEVELIGEKMSNWIEGNVPSNFKSQLRFIGTGPRTDDTILVL